MTSRTNELRASQARVLNMFVLYGDMHDHQLAEYLHDAERQAGLPLMSDSGVRSRRSELSKPNMDRLDALAFDHFKIRDFQACDPGQQEFLRTELRLEGFQSKLWDTGKEAQIGRRRVAVWGLAR